MTVQTITFNKSDWSGQEAVIKVRNGKFAFHGYDFELRNERTDKSEDGNSKWDFHTVDFYCDGEFFAKAHRFECDKEWEYISGDFTRSHENPAVLCAIVAANRI